MSIGHIPLDQIHSHPQNPRRHAVADEEMVDSIRSLGLMTAVTVAPAIDGTGYTMIGGHRRSDGARKAGLTQVPAIIREDLVTEAQQLEAMLVENLHRSDLTAVEEAEAYEQLTFAGLDVDAIAAATGRKASTIKSRLKLTGLAESTRERLHAGQMTLLDAEAMLEFVDDPEATSALEEAAGTDNFRYAVNQQRSRRERTIRRAASIAEFEEQGATVVEDPDWSQIRSLYLFRGDDDTLREAAGHDGCLGYVLPTSEWQDPYLVCADPARHPQPEDKPSAVVASDWEQQRLEREKRRALRDAATETRLAWLREHFTGLLTPRTHKELATAATAVLPMLIADGRETVDTETLLRGLGALPETTDYQSIYSARTSYASSLPTMKPAAVLGALAGWLAAVVLDVLDEGDLPAHIDDPDQVARLLAVWDWMKKAGYPLSDFDKEELTALEVRHTELAAEVEAEAS